MLIRKAFSKSVEVPFFHKQIGITLNYESTEIGKIFYDALD